MKHSKIRFREICGGIDSATLNVGITRKKVIVGKNKKIDDNIEINQLFIADQRKNMELARERKEALPPAR